MLFKFHGTERIIIIFFILKKANVNIPNIATINYVINFFGLFCFLGVETLDFKFLLKPKYNNAPCIVEGGPNRLLTGGTLQGDARLALFRLNADEVLEYRVFIHADRVSPFDLAASWRAYQENLRPSAVRGIPDVSINSVPEMDAEVHFNLQCFAINALPFYFVEEVF